MKLNLAILVSKFGHAPAIPKRLAFVIAERLWDRLSANWESACLDVYSASGNYLLPSAETVLLETSK